MVRLAPGKTAPGPVVGPIGVVAGTGLGVTGLVATEDDGEGGVDVASGDGAEDMGVAAAIAIDRGVDFMSRGTTTAPTPTRRTTMAAITRIRQRGLTDPCGAGRGWCSGVRPDHVTAGRIVTAVAVPDGKCAGLWCVVTGWI